MGLFDALLGRSQPKRPDLDSLFSVPGAALTLRSALGMEPTGTGTVCFRAASGPAFARVAEDVRALVGDGADAPDVVTTQDDFGYTWFEVRGVADDLSGLCTQLHAVNSTLESQGFATGLLCTTISFRASDGRPVALVYLYKQGTFYPFAPVPGVRSRDNVLELQVRDQLSGELVMEKDLQRWLALWDAPGL
ncbi:hypothetical protein IEQ44_01425 [Nocardioides sp. Y6]|uniref:Uncharacterized protein n=1 Tax=Nocardioides malaquae TaxID=2773426 RepID=A0ABR9RP81_9ACTN|nr:hypothetical protein [Nocardioides malaquae]MBE7323313.1 hypothetical protein [Nocardioides malaquae]